MKGMLETRIKHARILAALQRRKENTHNMLLAVVRIKSGWDILCNSRAIRYQCPQKTEKVVLNIAYASLVCTST